MRYLKRFNESQSFPRDSEQIIQICEELEITDYTIDDGGFVNADVVEISRQSFRKLPIKFGTVNQFMIHDCPNLTTLEGSPHTVNSFRCLSTSVGNLNGCPKTIRRMGGSLTEFYLSRCKNLTSLVGSPETIDSFVVTDVPITSLQGSPRNVNRNFYIKNCKITDLTGGPEELEGIYRIEDCPVISLKGAPKRVGDGFKVVCNRGGFDRNNYWVKKGVSNIFDVKEIRDIKIEGYLVLDGNPIDLILDVFEWHAQTNDSGFEKEGEQIFLDSLDYNYIRGTSENPQINLFRFKEALDEFGVDLPIICEEDLANTYDRKTLKDNEYSNPRIKESYQRIIETYPNGVEFLIKFGDYIFVDDSGRRVDFFGNLL